MKDKPVTFCSPSWDAVVLVCKDCQKRSNGPRHLKARPAVSALKHSLLAVKPRPRLVASSCLGICPKGALALAVVGGSAEARVACVQSLDDLDGVAALMFESRRGQR